MRWLPRFTPLEWLVALGILATFLALLLPSDLAVRFDENPNNTLPISDVFPAGRSVDLAADVQVTEIGRKAFSTEHQTIHFVLVNNGKTAVYFHGYRPTSFEPRLKQGQLRPFYKKRIQVGSGWLDKPFSRCGNGAATMCLMPRHAGRFYAIQHNDEAAIRIGVSYSPNEDAEEGSGLVAWSETLNFP